MAQTRAIDVFKRRKFEEVLEELTSMLGDPIKPNCELCNLQGIAECGIENDGNCVNFFPVNTKGRVYLDERWYRKDQSEEYLRKKVLRTVEEKKHERECLEYNVCPKCGAATRIVDAYPKTTRYGGNYLAHECKSCSWKEETEM